MTDFVRLKGTERVLADVSNERQRQVVVEGFSPATDDRHDPGTLARAAACYARFAGLVLARESPAIRGKDVPVVTRGVPCDWPWSDYWWKPRVPRHDLIRAIALLVAEVECLDRREQTAARAALLERTGGGLASNPQMLERNALDADPLREVERLMGLPEARRPPAMPVTYGKKREPFRNLAADVQRDRIELSDGTIFPMSSASGPVHSPPADSSPPPCDPGSSDSGGACGGGE